MKIVYNKIIPFKGYAAINIFGIMFVRKGEHINDRLINHELIHTAQMKELLYVFFYILYGLEWMIKLPFYRKKAYYNISFEREAYNNDHALNYIDKRKKYTWIRFVFSQNN